MSEHGELIAFLREKADEARAAERSRLDSANAFTGVSARDMRIAAMTATLQSGRKHKPMTLKECAESAQRDRNIARKYAADAEAFEAAIAALSVGRVEAT